MLSLSESGIVVICYFSAGTYEEYRDDKADFPPSALGNPVEYYPYAWWIDINDEVRGRSSGLLFVPFGGWLGLVSLPNPQRSLEIQHLWRRGGCSAFLRVMGDASQGRLCECGVP